MIREALVIGINRYPKLKDKKTGKAQHLEKPAADAEAIAQLLESNGNFKVRRFPEKIGEDGVCIVDPKPSRSVKVQELEEEIIKLFDPPTSVADTGLLFFAGHGLLKEKGGIREGFLALSDTNLPKNNWGISLHWLRKLLEKSKVRQQIVWLDCCHSGALLNYSEAESRTLKSTPDRCFITAARDYEPAYEQIGGSHGVLTSVLLPGLDPKNHQESFVSNIGLVNYINKQLVTARQRPLFQNTGNEIVLTGEESQLDRAIKMSGVCPYKGLESFDFNSEDPKYFYGRTKLTDLLLEKVRNSNFVAVLGASGSGKSSVVKAGLLYQLHLGEKLSGSQTWAIKRFRPGINPILNLASVFVESELCETKRKEKLAKAESLINTGVVGLKELIKATAGDNRLILAVEQFEEVFTLTENKLEREKFIEYLLELIEDKSIPICVIITMRADFFGKCAEGSYGRLAQKIEDNLVIVTPMNKEELVEAIVKPAEKVGLSVENLLVEQILMDIEGAEVLPLFQYTLTQLWQNRQVNVLTLSEYTKLGGIKGALKQKADETYEKLSVEEQLTAKRIFLELTKLGEGTEDTRRQIFKKDLVNERHSEEIINQVLSRLVNARLLVTNEVKQRGDSGKTITVVDVAHEALIRHWPKLRKWVEENRDIIRVERKIELAAQEWEEKGKPEDLGLLLQGRKLIEAEDYVKEYGYLGLLDNLALELIQVSKKVRDDLKKKEDLRKLSILQKKLRLKNAEQEKETLAKANKKASKQIKFGLFFLVVSLIISSTLLLQGIKLNRKNRITRRANLLEQKANNQLNFFNSGATVGIDALLKGMETAQSLYRLVEKKNLSFAEYPTIGPITTLRRILDDNFERNQLKQHSGSVNHVDISPDRSFIVTASSDDTARIWNIQGLEIGILEGHSESIYDVEISSDGSFIVTGSVDHTAKVWSLDGEVITTLKGHSESINDVEISSDGSFIVTGSSDNTAKVWSLDGEVITTLKGHEGIINNVEISSDGNFIVTVSVDHTARIWSLDGEMIASLEGHQGSINHLEISPDGSFIVTGSVDKTARIWSLDGEVIASLEGHQGSVNHLEISPDGNSIVTGSSDYTARIWSLDGEMIASLEGHQGSINHLEFSSDGSFIVTASSDHTARIWSSDGKIITILKGHQGSVNHVEICAFGSFIVTTSSDHTARIWESINEITSLKGHEDKVNEVAISPDGKWIVTVSDDYTGRIWDKKGNEISILEGHEDNINEVAISPDGKWIVTVSDDYTGRIWDKKGNEISILEGHDDNINEVAISPDGKWIVTVSDDDTGRIWDKKGNEIGILEGHEDNINEVAISPDGKWIVTASVDQTARIWNSSGRQIAILEGHEDNVNDVEISSDGRLIVTASDDKTARIWDPSGKEIAILDKHSRSVDDTEITPTRDSENYIVTASYQASFNRTGIIWDFSGSEMDSLQGSQYQVNEMEISRDGTFIVIASSDGTISIWDFSGNQIAQLTGHRQRVNDLAISSDESFIVTASDDKTARISYIGLEALLGYGCNWLSGYFLTHPEAQERLSVCLDESIRKIAAEYAVLEGRQLFNAGFVKAAIPSFANAKLWNSNLMFEAEIEKHIATYRAGR